MGSFCGIENDLLIAKKKVGITQTKSHEKGHTRYKLGLRISHRYKTFCCSVLCTKSHSFGCNLHSSSLPIKSPLYYINTSAVQIVCKEMWHYSVWGSGQEKGHSGQQCQVNPGISRSSSFVPWSPQMWILQIREPPGDHFSCVLPFPSSFTLVQLPEDSGFHSFSEHHALVLQRV